MLNESFLQIFELKVARNFVRDFLKVKKHKNAGNNLEMSENSKQQPKHQNSLIFLRKTLDPGTS